MASRTNRMDGPDSLYGGLERAHQHGIQDTILDTILNPIGMTSPKR